MPDDVERGGEVREHESTGSATGDVSPVRASARGRVRRAPGVSVALLCIADAVGLLLLIVLLSWIRFL